MATSKRTTAQSQTATSASDTAVSIPAPITSLNLQFVTEPNSPFEDGYSIAGEEAALAPFLADADRIDDENDPMFERYMELEDRRDRLNRMNARFAQRNGADPVVPAREAQSMNDLGTLVDEEEDQMILHTREGVRMFMGRGAQPGGAAPIMGGKRVASALRNLWALTANDNPYADWALIRHERALADVRVLLDEHIAVARAAMDKARSRGLSLSAVKSSSPVPVRLGFRSPYGYGIAALVSDFDHFVLIQKTLARKGLCGDAEEREVIQKVTRIVRRGFYEVARFDQWLSREECRSLSRADFLPQADHAGNDRVSFLTQVLGPVPAEIYSAKLQPAHSRRRVRISDAERQLLDSVGKSLELILPTADPVAAEVQAAEETAVAVAQEAA